jgi:hypothetical protein
MATPKDSGIPYSEKAKERYQELTDAILVPPLLKEWVSLMTARHGEKVKVHQSVYTNWLTALLIVRYGEAESFWPKEFSDKDINRAAFWLRGKMPEGVHYHPDIKGKADSILTVGLKTAVMMIVGGFLAWAYDPMFLLTLPLILGTALTDLAEDNMIEGFNRSKLLTIDDWTTQAYSVGDVVQPATWIDRVFRCVVAGTSTGSEPAFNTAIGAETTDSGGVVWVSCAVGPLKEPIFWALFTAAPGETGGGTEVTGGAYARTAHQPLDANYDAPAGGTGQTANSLAITFPAPSGANWGTVVSFARVDRATGTASMFSYASLTSSEVINDGDQAPRFAIGALTSTWA